MGGSLVRLLLLLLWCNFACTDIFSVGYLETKQLKALVRNIIDPARDLGHVDRALRKKGEAEGGGGGEGEGKKKSEKPEGAACEDCK